MDANPTSPDPSDRPADRLELVADPSRQATGLFKAIDYQLWQTVMAWIDLAEDEVLVVEGAEDFDIVGAGPAICNQVKNLGAAISLRSDCACETLRNFWVTRHKNPGRAVKLRFITTAKFSIEAGGPFGASRPGLELWNEEARRATPQRCGLLRHFLLSDYSVCRRLAEPFGAGVPSLVEHLRCLSSESFHSEFVSPIQWLSRQPDVDVIRETARIKSQAYGEDKHLLARDSERALTPLFEYVAHVAFRQRRVLRRGDFRVLFDDSVRVNVPLSQYSEMQAALVAASQATSLAASGVNYSVAEPPSIPDLPAPCAQRTVLVEMLASCVTEHRFLAIQGSTGKGKSTLAKLLALKLGGGWLWVSLARLKAERVAEKLRGISRHVAALAQAPSLLLDDFNPAAADLPPLLQELAVLSRLTLMHGGRMVVTTQRFLGDVFLRQSNLQQEVLQQATAFREEDIMELCLQAGCPPGNRLTSWINIISSQTKGHPQLVDARIKVAGRRGWPVPTNTDELDTPKEIRDERQLSRRLLQELDGGEIELLLRLSLASEPFRKDQAVAVGEISPSITRPGDSFDSLVGPWIEPAGDRYFRLSSLLAQAAEENWTAQRITAMRRGYARAILRTPRLTLIEASEALFQAVLAKDAALAGTVLSSFVLAPIKFLKNCVEKLGWMLTMPEPGSIFPNRRLVGHLFRLVQFRLAAASDGASAAKLAERLFEESARSIDPKVDSYVRTGAAMDIIMAFRVLVAPRVLLRCWLVAAQSACRDEHLAKVARLLEEQRRTALHAFPEQTFDEILFSFILSRRGGSSYLREFVAAVDELSICHREQVVGAIKANRFGLFGFVDGAWAHEVNKEDPDYSAAIAALEEASRAGEGWVAPEVCMIAARGIAVIQDEYLGKRDEALKTLASTAARVGDGVMLRYQRGMVHYLNKEYTEAFQIWSTTLDDWPDDDEEAALYAFHAFSNCGAAAGFLGRWEDAARVFGKGRDLALTLRRKLDALKFEIDAAYAAWRAQFRKDAIARLAQCLSDMEQLGRTDESTEFHTLWKVMEHVIVWCKCDAGAPHNLEVVAPRPGICSEAKTKERHDLVKDAARGPALLSCYCLAEAELYAGLGDSSFSAMAARSDVNDHASIRWMIEFLRARRALAQGDLENIPLFAESAALALPIIAEKSSDGAAMLAASESLSLRGAPTPDIVGFVEESLLCALLAVAAQSAPWETVLSAWSAAAPRMRCPAILLGAVDTIRRIYGATPLEIYRRHWATTSPRFSRVVAALQLVVHPETKPAMCYVGLCALVTDVGFGTNLMFSHDALGELTRKAWLGRLCAPFELRSPRLTVPAIRAACQSNKKGLALAATILLAAGDAVKVTRLTSIQTALSKLASGGVENNTA